LAPFFLFIVRHPKVVFVEYSPKQKLTKSLTLIWTGGHFMEVCMQWSQQYGKLQL
jgi:hypothetical protein